MKAIANGFTNSWHRRWAWIWLGLAAIVIAFVCWTLPHAGITSHVDFLPAMQQGAIAQPVARELSNRAEREVIWAIADSSDTSAAAEEFFGCLYATGAFEKLSGQVSEADRTQWNAFLSQWSVALMPQAITQPLSTPELYAGLVRAALFSPFAGVSAQELTQDPLLLRRARQLLSLGRLSFVDGWLTASDEQGERWRIIVGILKPGVLSNPYSLGMLALEERVAHASVAALYPQARIMGMGTFFEADRYLEQALNQIRHWGFPLLAFFFFLFVFFLRSPRPFFLWLLACVLGTAFGMAVVLLLFGEVHVHVLAMGTALCGFTAAVVVFWIVSCRQQGHRGRSLFFQWLFFSTLAAVSFAPIGWVPFAECREIAVLAVTGMAAVIVTCALWYPFLCRRLAVRFQPWDEWMERGLYAFPQRLAVVVFLLLFGSVVTGIVGKSLGMYAFDLERIQEQQSPGQLNRLLGEDASGRSFVVMGQSLEEALERSEELGKKLDILLARGAIESWSPVSLPSQEQQKQNFALVERAFPLVKDTLANLGIHVASNVYSDKLLPFSSWQSSSFGHLQWARIVRAGETWAVVLYVQASESSWSQLSQLAQFPNIYWLNPQGQQRQEFADAQQTLYLLIAALFILSVLGMTVCRGGKQGVLWTMPALLAAASASWCGLLLPFPTSVFAFLGVPVAFAVGTIFSILASDRLLAPGTRVLGMTLAALSIVGGFSLLCTFDAVAVRNFGYSVVCGTAVAFVAVFSLLRWMGRRWG